MHLYRLMFLLSIPEDQHVYQYMHRTDDVFALLARNEVVAAEHVRSDSLAEELYKECDSDDIVRSCCRCFSRPFISQQQDC